MINPSVMPARTPQDIQISQEIRRQVFMEEQELDIDGQDLSAVHFISYDEDIRTGTLRIRHTCRSQAKLELTAVLKSCRRKAVGKRIVEAALKLVEHKGISEVILSSQQPTAGFYRELGFQIVGELFEEAEITHITMVKR